MRTNANSNCVVLLRPPYPPRPQMGGGGGGGRARPVDDGCGPAAARDDRLCIGRMSWGGRFPDCKDERAARVAMTVCCCCGPYYRPAQWIAGQEPAHAHGGASMVAG
eukprot:COSAG01_NODE_5723_length_4074_cov_49.724277_2_plen_107_part_00